jgi:hypothetical protein
MQILSFDCGLRNLAAVVLRVPSAFQFPAEYRVYASEAETADEFKHRAMVYFLHCGWSLEGARLIDVSEALNRPARVKAVLKLSLMNKADALHTVLQRLETDWFCDFSPDIVAVEVQHNANAEMRAVSLAIPVFFKRSMATTEYIAVTGGQKLKLCDAAGVKLGDGLMHVAAVAAAKKAARKPAKKARGTQLTLAGAAAAAVPVRDRDPAPTEPILNALESDFVHAEAASTYKSYNPRGKRWKTSNAASTASGMSKKDKYEDNKARSTKAMSEIVKNWKGGVLAPLDLLPLLYDPNVADALLQAVWVLWTKLAPRAPTKRRKRAASPTSL